VVAGVTSWCRRRDVRLVAALPGALEALAGGLRAGLGLIEAVEKAGAVPGPLGEDLRLVAARARSGSGLAGSVARWAEERPLPEVRVVAGALEVALAVGGPSAAALDGLAEALRDRRGAIEEARALSAQARLSALVVAVAPVASVGLSGSFDRRLLTALLAPGPGRGCLVGGLALEVLAAAWMRRILRPV
jgi:tight adherence protein B